MPSKKEPFISTSERRRLAIVAIGIFFFFSALIVQFYRIQILEGETWTQEAKKQHLLFVTEPFHRGAFFSNTSVKKGNPESPRKFTVDIQKYHLYIDPQSIPEIHRDPIANFLSKHLKLRPKQRQALRSHFNRKSRSRKLAMWLEQQDKSEILRWWNPYAKKNKIAGNAVYFVTDYQRSYPFGKLLGQVLHTVQNNKDELSKQAIPTGGLELYFNEYLKGKPGKRRLLRSPRNAFETGVVIEPPEHGCDIILTVNDCLQAICEEGIEKGVRECNAKSGWAVLMEPFTGEILALAQYPFFHPTECSKYFNNPDQITHTKVKAITDANEPGSVMKPITAAIAMLANEELQRQRKPPLFSPEEKIPTANGKCKGRKNLRDGRLHHFLNMYMAIQRSSNIYFGRVIERVIETMGNSWYRNALLYRFGFGLKTGIELPSESPGVVPTPGKKHPNGTLEWSVPTPYSLAMGHNIQANTVQMARAYSIFANGGILVKPTLVKKIIKNWPDGTKKVLVDHTSQDRVKAFPRVLPEKITREVVKAIKFATKPGGSAWRGEIWGFTEAGKTGTSIKIRNGAYDRTLNFSSFIGFAPAKHPRFVLAVAMDEPEYGYIPGVGKNDLGGKCAAPVFSAIATKVLQYLGENPDDPYGYPRRDRRYDPDKADWVPETRRLQEMYEKWNKIDVQK